MLMWRLHDYTHAIAIPLHQATQPLHDAMQCMSDVGVPKLVSAFWIIKGPHLRGES